MGKNARTGTVRGDQVSPSLAGTRPELTGADQSAVWQVGGERHCGGASVMDPGEASKPPGLDINRSDAPTAILNTLKIQGR